MLEFQSDLDAIFGRSSLVANTISLQFRDDISQLSTMQPTIEDTFATAEIAVDDTSNLLGDLIWSAEMLSFLLAFLWVNDRHQNIDRARTPTFETFFPSIPTSRPPAPPTLIPGRFGDAAPRQLRFPKIEEGAKRLVETNVLPPDQFNAATDDIRQRSFTAAGEMGQQTREKIRDTLAENIRTGASQQQFKENLDNAVKNSFLGPSHLDTVFRTNTQAAFRDGRETILQNPIIDGAFPYQEYIPIRDDRVRPNHQILETLGLDGTGIYRRDDSFWDHFTPPWDYNCRCAVNLLTIEDAADAGVQEAIDWLASGSPPITPQHVYSDGNFPVEPNPGWGSRGRVPAGATA